MGNPLLLKVIDNYVIRFANLWSAIHIRPGKRKPPLCRTFYYMAIGDNYRNSLIIVKLKTKNESSSYRNVPSASFALNSNCCESELF